jgi:hypothetical protein
MLNIERHIFRLGCWLLIGDKFQLCFASANVNIFYLQRVENRAFVYLHRDA